MSFFPKIRRDVLLLGAVAATAMSFVGPAGAIDRKPFVGRSVTDARPGYGASSGGYGAERQYYGAENRVLPRGGGWSGSDGIYGGSVIRFGDDLAASDAGYVSPFGVEDARSGVYPGFETAPAGSFLYLDDQAENRVSADRVRPNLRSVEHERLDRRPVDPSGITIHHLGTAKIIRISAVAAETNAGRPVEESTARSGLAPWSEGWKRYCSRAHPNFDSKLGTFTDPQGSQRFCTGD